MGFDITFDKVTRMGLQELPEDIRDAAVPVLQKTQQVQRYLKELVEAALNGTDEERSSALAKLQAIDQHLSFTPPDTAGGKVKMYYGEGGGMC